MNPEQRHYEFGATTSRLASITRYDDRFDEEVSLIRAQSSHLSDQGESDLRLSDDVVIGLVGSQEDRLNLRGRTGR